MFNINKIFNKKIEEKKPSNINNNVSKVLAGVMAVGGVASSQSVLGANKDKVLVDKTVFFEEDSSKTENAYIMSKEDLRNINELSKEEKIDLIRNVLNSSDGVVIDGNLVHIKGEIEKGRSDYSIIPVTTYNLKTSTYYINNNISIPWAVNNPSKVLDFVEANGLGSVDSKDDSESGKIKVSNHIIEANIINPSFVYNRIRDTGKSIEESILLMSQKDKSIVKEIVDGLYESISSGGVFENNKDKIDEVKREIEEIESINLENIHNMEHLANN